jgi:putative oxidoreductase
VSFLISSSGRQAGWGLFLLRLILGVIMFVAGWKKLFDFGVPMFGKALAGLGVPLPVFLAWAVTLLEVVGGAFIIIGLLSRLIALLLAIDMVVAILLVTIHVGFLSSSGKSGIELNLLLIGGFLAILFAGPGSISVDRLLEGGRATGRSDQSLAGGT